MSESNNFRLPRVLGFELASSVKQFWGGFHPLTGRFYLYFFVNGGYSQWGTEMVAGRRFVNTGLLDEEFHRPLSYVQGIATDTGGWW